jgi:hypothetical protein
MLTVKELRDALSGLPDELELVVHDAYTNEQVQLVGFRVDLEEGEFEITVDSDPEEPECGDDE